MALLITICGLVIVFAFEIRHRMVTEQLAYLDREMHRLAEEIKALQEENKKKAEAEVKKGFKFPFMP